MLEFFKRLFRSLPEQAKSVPTYEVKEEFVSCVTPVEEVKSEKPDFSKMKKVELVQYIKDNSLEINTKLKKAEIIAALVALEA